MSSYDFDWEQVRRLRKMVVLDRSLMTPETIAAGDAEIARARNLVVRDYDAKKAAVVDALAPHHGFAAIAIIQLGWLLEFPIGYEPALQRVLAVPELLALLLRERGSLEPSATLRSDHDALVTAVRRFLALGLIPGVRSGACESSTRPSGWTRKDRRDEATQAHPGAGDPQVA